MNRHISALVFAAAFVCVIVDAGRSDGSDGEAGIRVELKSRQETYLLGEPVLFEVVVINTTGEAVRMAEVHVDVVEPEVEIYISGDGNDLYRWMLGVRGFGRITRGVLDLDPNEPVRYALRVVHDWQHPSRLAFPEPGQFEAKVHFPFREEGSATRIELESNRVDFRVERPVGDAMKVWERINSPEVLLFMQTGGATKELVLEVASLLKSSDRTPYHEPLEWALSRYYARALARMKITENEAQLLRDVLGIEMSPQALADDTRLDQVITYHFTEQTSLEEVFAQITRQSGVPLSIHAQLRERTLITARITQPLRDLMNARAATDARWIRKGDGYMLVPLHALDGTRE